MRVAIVNRHPLQTVGGSEIQCHLIAEGLTELGHEVTYVSPTLVPLEPKLPYEYVGVRSPQYLLAQILDADPDVVYWRYNLNHFFSVARGLSRSGVPIFFAASHVNDLKPWVWLPTGSALSRLKGFASRRWNRWGFRYVGALSSINPEHLPTKVVARSVLIRNGMVTDRESFSWPRPFIVWVANLKPAKRPELFVRVARVVEPLGIDALMVGQIQSPKYRGYSQDGFLPPNVHYLGSRSLEQVNGILAQSLMLVHTCVSEGFGNVFIQAWLQGRPTISYQFDPGGMIRRLDLGAVADADWDIFRRVVSEWAVNSALREMVGRRAHANAIELFSVEKMVSTVESELIALAERLRQ